MASGTETIGRILLQLPGFVESLLAEVESSKFAMMQSNSTYQSDTSKQAIESLLWPPPVLCIRILLDKICYGYLTS